VAGPPKEEKLTLFLILSRIGSFYFLKDFLKDILNPEAIHQITRERGRRKDEKGSE